MSDFSTTAEILFTPDEASLQNVREQVEEIGPIAVEYEPTRNPIAADGGRRGGARSGGTGPSVTSGTSASEPEGVVGILAESLEVQEAMLDHLDDINEDTDLLGMPGGGGGDGIFSFLFDEGGDIVGGLGEQLTNVVGDSVGTAIGNALTDESVSVEEPDWVPIEVEDPGEAPVDAPDSIGVDSPESIPVDAPNSIGVNAPDSIGVDDPSPLEVEDIGEIPVEDVKEIPIEDVGELPVEDSSMSVDVSVSVDGAGLGGGGPRGFGEWVNQKVNQIPMVGDEIADLDRRGTNLLRKAIPGGPGPMRRPEEIQQSQRSASGRANVQVSASSGGRDVTVNNRTQSKVTVDPSGLDSLRKDILSAVEKGHQENREELQSEIDAIEKELQRLKDDLTRR